MIATLLEADKVIAWDLYVQLSDGTKRTFRRYSAETWEQLLGQSWEPLYIETNTELVPALELMYQQASLA